MPYEIETCRCSLRGDPTPAFCDDDLFCPQCGKSVAWIDSDHLLPDPESTTGGSGRTVLWVYGREENDGSSSYELNIDFFQINPQVDNSGGQPRNLELSRDECTFSAPGFESRIKIETRGSRATLRLVPEDAGENLPAKGVRGELKIVGNCGVIGQVLAGRPGSRDLLDVLVFNKSYFLTEVEGDGVQRQYDAGDTWQLWHGGPQNLTVKIQPIYAPVYLTNLATNPTWPIEEDTEFPFKVLHRPSSNAVYGPDRPVSIVLEVNPDDPKDKWEAQKPRKLGLQLDFALGQSLAKPLASEPLILKRQDGGVVQFTCGNDLPIPPMFYGEVITTPPKSQLLPEIFVKNSGTTMLPALVPVIADKSPLSGLDWIKVGWNDGSDGRTDLEPRAEKAVRLSINLKEVNPGNHHEGDPLKAEVHVEHADYGMKWPLGITIKSVGHRPALEAPLALDFGSTNSYASAELPGSGANDPINVRSLLVRMSNPETTSTTALKSPAEGGSESPATDPETFATALAFRDLADEQNPDYEIGRDALKLGKERPLHLERGLKRALSSLRPCVDQEGKLIGVNHKNHPFNRRKYIYPREGNEPARYSLRELIGFYLLEAIARCEKGERRTVTQLGLSYPANLGPEPRRALNLVIKDVEAACKARHPERDAEISFFSLGPDEASAVALGFVLDPVILKQRIIPLFSNEDKRASFMLASFDFGGGSIDIALIKFDLHRLPPRTTFASRLLGLGGDEHFGGDNVTVAAYEILASRIAELLGPRDRLSLAPLNVQRYQADPGSWTNRQALWSVAELAKRASCQGRSTDVRAEIIGELKALQPDDQSGLEVILKAAEAGKLDLDLQEIYQHQIKCDLSGVGGYRVEDRLRRCVQMLREFADRAEPGASPKFLILAGAACRVPLARELLRAEFLDAVIVPEDEGIPDSYRPKSKVADGLARFLAASHGSSNDHRIQGLNPAHLYTHADLLWINPIQRYDPLVWVPSCVELQKKEWHLLKDKHDPDEHIPLIEAWNPRRKLTIDVHRRASPEPELVGTARLDRQAELIEPGVTPDLPPPSSDLDQAQVMLRIDDEEDCLRVRIRINEAEFGDWRVQPNTPCEQVRHD